MEQDTRGVHVIGRRTGVSPRGSYRCGHAGRGGFLMCGGAHRSERVKRVLRQVFGLDVRAVRCVVASQSARWRSSAGCRRVHISPLRASSGISPDSLFRVLRNADISTVSDVFSGRALCGGQSKLL